MKWAVAAVFGDGRAPIVLEMGAVEPPDGRVVRHSVRVDAC